MRVMFVDDETRVLEAIERVLFELDTSWELSFLSSASQALEELSRSSYDVVVSDLRMTGIDGAELLTRVAQLYPRVVRIVLSGHSDEDSALKMVQVAHQFLAKPCGAETLHRIISRAEQLADLLPDRRLQTMVGQIGSLPCTRDSQERLVRLLDREEVSLSAVTSAVSRDPALTAKMLQVASSAFFNSSASVTDVESALMRLGVRTLRNLIRNMCSDDMPLRPSALPTESAVHAVCDRAVRIAELAAGMARLPEDAAAAHVAGLLCDVGELILVNRAPERHYVGQSEAAQLGLSQHAAELATFGSTHAEIGAYLLGLWGLPVQIVQAVANHHTPERDGGDRMGLSQLVWLASCIVDGEEPQPELLSRFGAEQLYRRHRRATPEHEP